jgi:PAS domain S-box-containing protein
LDANNINNPKFSGVAGHALSPTKKSLYDDRRSDWEMRKAVDNIQTYFFSPGLETATHQSALSAFSSLYRLEYGTAYIASPLGACLTERTASMSPPKVLRYGRVSADPSIDRAYLSWIKNEQHIFKIKIYNKRVPEQYQGIFGKDKRLSSLAFIPIACNGRLVSMFVLGLSTREFEADFTKRISPLAGSVVCALQSSFESPNYKDSIGDLIGQNSFLSSLIVNSPSAILMVKDEIVIVNNASAIDLLNSGKKPHLSSSTPAEFIGKRISTIMPSFNKIFEWSSQPKNYDSHTSGQGAYIWENETIIKSDGTSTAVCLSVFRYNTAKGQVSVLQFFERLADNEPEHTSGRSQEDSGQTPSAEITDLMDGGAELITNSMPVGLLKLNLEWRCEFANDKWCEYTGLCNIDSLGHKWVKSVHSEDLQFLMEDLYVCATFQSEIRREIRLISPLGNIIWVSFVARAISDPSESVSGIVATVIDITESRNYSANLKNFALTDSLTSLYNRTGLLERIERQFVQSSNDTEHTTLAFFDLDGFKAVNDYYGHSIGDDVLIEVAQRIDQTFAKSQVKCLGKNISKELTSETSCRYYAARFGGDEFVILFPIMIEPFDAKSILTSLLLEIAKPFEIQGEHIVLTASIGMATNKLSAANARLMLNQADKALYYAKDAGKNTVKSFDELASLGQKEEGSLLTDLRKGLHYRRFSIAYQPIVDAHSKSIVGLEALLRFTDSKGNLVMPDQVIPELEKSGLIVEVGDWVVLEACRQVASWIKTGVVDNDIYVSINASAHQLTNEHLYQVIERASIDSGLPYENIVIEVTESSLIKKPDRTASVLSRIRSAGVRLALDDFGTGYCSMSYLQKFEFDLIKIEKAFTRPLTEKSENYRIVSAIIALARLFDLKVTAEGIESEHYIRVLDEMGIDNIQGYVTSKPLLPSKATDFLTDYYH